MNRFILFLFIFSLPNTVLGYDYFIASNCIGLSGSSSGVDHARLTSCVNELINGINETRRTLDNKTNQTQEKIGRVDSSLDLMQRTVHSLPNDSKGRITDENTPVQETESPLAKMEKYREENDEKIKQLEKRLSALEAILSGNTDEGGPPKQKAGE